MHRVVEGTLCATLSPVFRSSIRAVQALWRIQFVRNILTLQASSVVSSGIGFLKSVLFFRLLGVHLFGVYAVVLSFTGTMSVITNLGQNQAALTFFAEAYARKDSAAQRSVIRYYFQLAAFACAVLTVFAFFAPAIAAALYADATIGTTARIGFLAMAVGSFDTLFTIVLQTVHEIRRMAILENVNILLQLVFSVAFLLFGWGPAGILGGVLLSNILMLGTYAYTYRLIRARYHLPLLGSAVFAQSGPSTRTYMGQGLWIAVDKNIGNLFPQSLFFTLSLFSAPAVVGMAQLAFKIAALPRTLFIPSVGRMATTALAALHTKSTAALRAATAKILKHSLALHSLFTLAGLVVLPPMALVLYGWEIADAIPAMLWLILIQLISGLNVVNSPLFRLLRRAHIPAVWGMITLPLDVLLLVGLTHVLSPMMAFVWAVFAMYVLNLFLNAYLYFQLRRSPR